MPEVTSPPWPCHPEHENWRSHEVSSWLLHNRPPQELGQPAALLPPSEDPQQLAIPVSWLKMCGPRVLQFRDQLRSEWRGLLDDEVGYLTDWLVAGAIARENVLLIGRPGVAKSQIATRFFELLGLKQPSVDSRVFQEMATAGSDLMAIWEQWQRRSAAARSEQKYFHYLLSRFTQPEELFGPVEIMLLRQGVLVRVNFGLLTGPGVRAAFIDECFKASSSVLNTLLTLTQERVYFNWGGMQPADLVILIGASNEMPGVFAGGGTGAGTGEEFQTFYAFVDRFTLRLEIPMVTGHRGGDVAATDLGQAFTQAIQREARLFTRGRLFEGRRRVGPLASINDLLLLGRACLQHVVLGGDNAPLAGGPGAPCLFQAQSLTEFDSAFLNIAADLQGDNTEAALNSITWTISPRKLKALYKVALAHAIISDDNFLTNASAQVVSALGRRQANVFKLIWDSPVAKPQLVERVRALIDDYF